MIQIALESPFVFAFCVLVIVYAGCHAFEFLIAEFQEVIILHSLRDEKGTVTREILEAYADMQERINKSKQNEDRDQIQPQ